MKLKTWHYEHLAIGGVLLAVWAANGAHAVEAVGTLAVYLTHGTASIGDRMQERQAASTRPSVECHQKFWWYYIGKEATWFAYFTWMHAWSALAGCILFGLYPVWRRYYRQHVKPLES